MIFLLCSNEHNSKVCVILSALIEMTEITFVTDKMDFCSGCVIGDAEGNDDDKICTSLELCVLIAH